MRLLLRKVASTMGNTYEPSGRDQWTSSRSGLGEHLSRGAVGHGESSTGGGAWVVVMPARETVSLRDVPDGDVNRLFRIEGVVGL